MPEWPNGAVLKTAVAERLPGVRIPLSPPVFSRPLPSRLTVSFSFWILPLLALDTPGSRAAPPHGDPARLARIRAAKMPPIKAPVPFDTAEADAILSALEVFPPDNPWNLVVEDWPVHP